MNGEQKTWYDEAAGPLVRPYAVTRGRTWSSRSDLQVITLVVATVPVTRSLARRLGPEHLQILSTCAHPVSVAELSAALSLPLSVVKILLSDLVDLQLVALRTASAPEPHVLQAVIDGLRRL